LEKERKCGLLVTGLEEMVLLGLIESEGVRERREAMDCREERETVSGEIACWRFVERERE